MTNRYAVVSNSVVTNVVIWDGESYLELADGETAVASDSANIGCEYRLGEFIAPPAPPIPDPTPAEILAANTGERDFRLAAATLAIAPLQDAVDLDEATDAETALLKKWKQYRIAVNRVDLTAASTVWPTAPA
ncbi:hypothetical protein NS376_15975 [Pseudomonas oryzihabitans]|nr:hypothetical protein NS376_15975 [Pseudomonas psychrotolerans]